MGLMGRELVLAGLFSLLCLLLFPCLLPSWRLSFFAPFLIMALYRDSAPLVLWCGILSGLCMDLLVTDHRLGLFALIYAVSSLLLFSWRQSFFAENLSTIPLLTFFLSIFSSFIHLTVLFVLEEGLPLTSEGLFSDFFLMPLLDCAYSLCFAVPLHLWQKRSPPLTDASFRPVRPR